MEGIFSIQVPGADEDGLAVDDDALFICSEQSLLTSGCSNGYLMQLLSKCSETSDSTRSKFLASFLIDHMLDFRSSFLLGSPFRLLFLLFLCLLNDGCSAWRNNCSPFWRRIECRAAVQSQRQSSSSPLLTSHFLPLFVLWFVFLSGNRLLLSRNVEGQ